MNAIKCNDLLGIICLILFVGCNSSNENVDLPIKEKSLSIKETDSITDAVMLRTKHFFLNSQERRDVLDSAIVAHPNIAYFYQQRAMPLYKENKDELGLPFLERAAKLDPLKYIDYMRI